jgi:hypothetical protein
MFKAPPEAGGAPPAAGPPPWTTPPTDQGHAMCAWCGRAIYVPAVPCSVRPDPGLLTMNTGPGLGDRCKWELSTRTVTSEPGPRPAGTTDSPDR